MVDTAGLPLTPKLSWLTDIAYTYSIGSSYTVIDVGVLVIAGDVFNVLTTFIGDEPGNPIYGSNLPLYVFENFTNAIEQLALLDVYNALRTNIPGLQMSLPNTALYVNPANRIVGIGVGIHVPGGVLPVDISFS